jgi:hypothetical protein
MQLASQPIAQVEHAASGAVRDIEGAAGGPAKRAPRVSIATGGWNEITGTRSRHHESRELVLVEQLGRHAATAGPARIRTMGRREPGRAARARADLGELGGERALASEDLLGERALGGLDGF